jgi:hypothetical protein
VGRHVTGHRAGGGGIDDDDRDLGGGGAEGPDRCWLVCFFL